MNQTAFIKELKRVYLKRKLSLVLLRWLGYLLIFIAVLIRSKAYSFPAFIIILLLGLTGITFLIRSIKTILNLPAINLIQHLNHTQPGLQQSGHLLLLPPASLNVLEQMQVTRITPLLANLNIHKAITIPARPAWFTFAASLAMAGLLYFLPGFFPASVNLLKTEKTITPPALKAIQKSLPQIKSVTITVNPPQYTGLPKYAEKQLDFKIPAGSQITWIVKTKGEVNQMYLVLPSRQPIHIQKMKDASDTYTLKLKPDRTFLYTIDLKNQKSELHSVEVLPDLAPVITINKPKPFTEIAFGDRQELNLAALLTDDYGLQRASLVATVAKGSGENVTFKEIQYPLNFSSSGGTKNQPVTKNLHLKTLGMSYGDELYYYVEAWDYNHGYARSESHFLQIEDTTVVTDGGDMALGISVVPAYFRSQRQLIIDTEKLIQEKKNLTPGTFADQSNNLGAEQKLLRLRYGKFLGEESVTAIGAKPEEGHSADDGHDHGQAVTDKNDPASLLDPFIHKHDTEEDASYFEPAVKIQLKAALAHMWEAELQLRLGKPQLALPFEYKALRQLKEVQQKSRAYVRKMGFTPPKIEESEKRLSGELTKISVPTQQINTKDIQKYPAIREVLPWMVQQKAGPVNGKTILPVLQLAGQELAQSSLNQPGIYLAGLRDLRKLIIEVQQGRITCNTCIITVTSAFEQILPKPKPAASSIKVYRHKLAEDYFRRLN